MLTAAQPSPAFMLFCLDATVARGGGLYELDHHHVILETCERMRASGTDAKHVELFHTARRARLLRDPPTATRSDEQRRAIRTLAVAAKRGGMSRSEIMATIESAFNAKGAA